MFFETNKEKNRIVSKIGRNRMYFPIEVRKDRKVFEIFKDFLGSDFICFSELRNKLRNRPTYREELNELAERLNELEPLKRKAALHLIAQEAHLIEEEKLEKIIADGIKENDPELLNPIFLLVEKMLSKKIYIKKRLIKEIIPKLFYSLSSLYKQSEEANEIILSQCLLFSQLISSYDSEFYYEKVKRLFLQPNDRDLKLIGLIAYSFMLDNLTPKDSTLEIYEQIKNFLANSDFSEVAHGIIGKSLSKDFKTDEQKFAQTLVYLSQQQGISLPFILDVVIDRIETEEHANKMLAYVKRLHEKQLINDDLYEYFLKSIETIITNLRKRRHPRFY
jgi:hypothetical protein